MGDLVSLHRGIELYATGRRRLPLKAGSKLRAGLAKLGIESLQDLLLHLPRRHVDRRELKTIAQLKADAARGLFAEVQICATVRSGPRRIADRRNPRRFRITAELVDETGCLTAVWFNNPWPTRLLKPGVQAFFTGKLRRYAGSLQLSAPGFELVKEGTEPFSVGRIVPIYPACADVASHQLRRLVWAHLPPPEAIVDPLPDHLRRRLGLMTRGEALHAYHFPEDNDDVAAAKRRLVFDEVFTLQLGLVYRKAKLERSVQGVMHDPPAPGSLAESFVAALPFELTGAQRRACAEVAADMAKPCPMHRLLEGEVGSGKTVVALYACLIAIGGGFQAAFMAPTEVLAEQHHLSVSELLERAFGADEARNLFAAVSRRPVVRLLTGSTPAAERNQILTGVARGEVDLLIGTHALIQESVEFARLGLAVVDEQHRFGVHQRRSLLAKGATGEPDVLVMTATPIPRTLAVSIYGDLDLSILDELPRGRRPIATKLVLNERERGYAYDLIRSEVAAGRQAYIVYALKDESSSGELRNAKAESKRLATEVFPDLRVGLVHGDMKSADKERVMAAFRAGDIDVLVATTVVEVGVDVPNATVMMVEDADRFGLAQLHQLRGRVGRGPHPSYCVLATQLDPASEDPRAAEALRRLSALKATTDGFRLALIDLELRKEGQLLGAKQSGAPQLRLARVLEHQDLIALARRVAVELIEQDPELRAWEHQALEREMRDRFRWHELEVIGSG
jgi:ATP-dependent DNA helicase RecG